MHTCSFIFLQLLHCCVWRLAAHCQCLKTVIDNDIQDLWVCWVNSACCIPVHTHLLNRLLLVWHATRLSSHHTMPCLVMTHTFSKLQSNWLLCGCSQPADKYPDMFRQTGLFGRFPFALPTMIAAVLSLVGTHGSHCCTLHKDTAASYIYLCLLCYDVVLCPVLFTLHCWCAWVALVVYLLALCKPAKLAQQPLCTVCACISA